MKRIILILISILFFIPSFAQYNIEVGSYEYLELDPPMGWVRNAYWSCDEGLKITEGSEVGAIVNVTHYFSGSAYVNVSYTYEYEGSYDGHMHASTGSKSYRITCIGGTASISDEYLELNVGQSYTLKCSRSMSYGTPTWTSSDEDIVTINSKGKLTAVSPGSAIITLDPITAESCFCEVNVLAVEAQTIKLVPEHLEIIVGKTATLKPEYTPQWATATVTWSSENENIATVSSSGIVRGITAGETVIVAKTEKGLRSQATVKILGEPEYINLPERLEIPEGYHHKLTPAITPEDAYATYSWNSSDTSIIKVDNEGNIIAKKPGVAEVTVTTQNMKTATCKVEVKRPSEGMDYRNVRIHINALKALFNDINR